MMKSRSLLLMIGFVGACLNAFPADLIFVSPVKSDVILLYFREGEKNTPECISYNTFECEDIWNSGPLDPEAAKDLTTYSISSPDDGNYSSARHPLKIGYKSKKEAALKTYWVYLELPAGMKEGKSYTISLEGLAANDDARSFVFNTKNRRSEAIHINQAGYAPNAGMKFAYIYQWMGSAGGVDFSGYEGNTFYLIRHSDSTVVYSSSDHGKGLRHRAPLQLENTGASGIGWHGTAVWECDFSDIGNSVAVDPGEYRLAIDGIGCSFPFRISKDVYHDLYYLLVRGLYHQRSGHARTSAYTPYVKPVDHMPGENGFKITYSEHHLQSNDGINFEQLPAKATNWIWPDNPYPHMNDEPDGWGWGGHFDAADYDRTRSHIQVSTDLLLVYEMNPRGFADEELNIPESGNGMPDLIDEAQWGIDFFRRLKGPTGGICGGLETTGYYHPSWEDTNMWYAFAEDGGTSWAYAGAAAHLAWCYELSGAGQDTVNSWIQEAEEAYAWAETNYPGDAGRSYIEQKYYAAAGLYRITGNHEYIGDFTECRTWYDDLDNSAGTFIFCLTPADKWANFTVADENLQSSLRSSLMNMAMEQGINQARERALRFIKYSNPYLGWGGYYPHVMLQMFYHHVTGDEEVLDLLYTTADMYLGINNDQRVYITGAENAGADRVHRDILHVDSYYDGIPGWIPGIPPYKYASEVYNSGFFYEPSDPHDWPLMEQCNDTRDYIPASEFTVQETVSPTASLFSYLKALSSGKQFVIDISLDQDSVFIPGSDVSFAVNASVSEGSITGVEVFSGSSLIGTDSEAPFEFTMPELPAGVYSITAIAYSGEESKKSGPVTLVVDDLPPSDPSGLQITHVERLLIEAQWTPSVDDAGIKQYEVFVNDQLWTTSILPEVSIEGLSSDTPYSIYVIAVDYAGHRSAASNTADTVTLAGKQIPGLIQGEDYDAVSGEVQTEFSHDTDNTDYVGWFDEGESLEYAVEVENEGYYLVTFRVARGIAEDDFEFYSGAKLLATIIVPETGGWAEWTEVSKVVYLEAGPQNLVVANTGNPFNINWINFEPAVETEGVVINNCPSDSIAVSGNYTLSASVIPENASDTAVSWSSLDENIALVDEDGTIHGVSAGTTTIVVTTSMGDYTADCNIRVFDSNIPAGNDRMKILEIYPNPARENSINIRGEMLKNSRIIITDVNGRVLLQQVYGNINETLIDVSELEPGVYFIRITGERNIRTRKLIIE